MDTFTTPLEIRLYFVEKSLARAELIEKTSYLSGGVVIVEKVAEPSPLSVPLSEDVLGIVAAGLFARVAELEDEIVNFQRLPEPSPEPPAAEAALISKLNEAFQANIPAEMRPAFAIPYAIVRVLVEAEQYDLAAAVIAGIAVPPELEAAKTNLIAILPI